MSDETRIILVRHGESNVTVERVLGGPLSCTGLSPLGREQAEHLRDRWAAGAEPKVDVLWSSTMPRARETAQILNEHLQLDHQIEEDLEERRPGEADGIKFSEYQEQYGNYDRLQNRYEPISPGGESAAGFFLRAGKALDDVVTASLGKTAVVVCHGGVVDVIFRDLLGLAPQGGFYLWTLNTSITEFVLSDETYPRRWRLVRYNDSAHLAGLPAETPRAE